jgi:hypothetical protein
MEAVHTSETSVYYNESTWHYITEGSNLHNRRSDNLKSHYSGAVSQLDKAFSPCKEPFMSMGWDYVSELQPPSGLLFIPQMIYEHGEPRWNDTDRENWFVYQSSLAILPAVI